MVSVLGAETGKSLGLLASQFTQIGEFQFQQETLSGKIRWGVTEEDTRRVPVHIHIYEYMQL